jgi:hypothetical protein
MSAIVTVRASSPETQKALLSLADTSTEVLEIGSRIAGTQSFQVWFKAASVQPNNATDTLFALIVDRFPAPADDIELDGPADDILPDQHK